MKRVVLLTNIGRSKAGWGIEVEDAVADMWVATGKAKHGPPDLPLKQGQLENYNNCNPLTPAEIAAKAAQTKKATPPLPAPAQAAAAAEEDE